MQNEVEIRKKFAAYEEGRQTLECQWMIQTIRRRRQIPYLFVRFDKQRSQIEYARSELPQSLGVDARNQVSVIGSIRGRQDGNVMPADGIAGLGHLRPVVVEERVGMPDMLHDVSIPHRARMLNATSGHQV